MVSLIKKLGMALAAFTLIVSCGAAGTTTTDTTASTGIARAADGDIDGLIVEYGQIVKSLGTLTEKAAAGDLAAATEASNYGMRMLEITTALSTATLTTEQTTKYAEAASGGINQ